MLFRTVLKANKSLWEISHKDIIFSIGSCFADFIGNELIKNEFQVCTNPFGIIYNPLSVIQNLTDCLEERHPDKYLFLENKRHYHYNFHSQVNGSDQTDLIRKIERIREDARTALLAADVIVITLGTAFVYFLKSLNVPVANCHKMQGQLFEKKMLLPQEITDSFSHFIEILNRENSGAKIVITVSPVRHIRDTPELNSVSKSVLRLVSWQLTQMYPDKITYFPSFEIMMDDLRDYRFYKDDMIHPSEQAEKYIWKCFCETFFTSDTIQINNKIVDLLTAANHKPFQSESAEYRIFLEKIMEKAKNLNDKVAVKGLIGNVALKLGL